MAVWRPKPEIRAISVAAIWRGGELLVEAVRDDDGAIKGWRPLGGRIEFGESAAEALKREFLEELGAPVDLHGQIAVLENIYEHHGARGHEIVFVFEATFVQPRMYDRDEFLILEGESAGVARWIAIDEFLSGKSALFPEALLNRLIDFNSGDRIRPIGE